MKLIKFQAIFDSHGDMVDPAAEKAAREFCEHFRPTVRIHGGDAFDLRALRSGASKEEKGESVKADIEAGCDLFGWFKPTVWIKGNHDERLYRHATECQDGNLKLLCRQLIDSIEDGLPNGCEVVPYGKRRGVWKWGGYKWVHGYSHGLHAVYKAAQVYGNVVMGHTHVPSGPVLPPRDDGSRGYGCGCLCRVDMDYNSSQLNTIRQANGFLYGWLSGGRAVINHALPDDTGRWIFPTEFSDGR